MRARILWILLLVLAPHILNPVWAAGNKTKFMNSDQTATLDCKGGEAQLIGSNNTLTINGNCAGLDLFGSDNKITIEFAPHASMQMGGSRNVINWSGTPDKPPTAVQAEGSSSNVFQPPLR